MLCFGLALALEVDVAGDGGLASVGVGGVIRVVGVAGLSTRLGGVAGSVVMILFGADDGREGVDWVSAES